MTPKPITENTLFYGDNLPILREYVAEESVDLVYLDPPFNSNRSYNVLFRNESGTESESQITAFEDTWHWNRAAEQTYNELVTQAPSRVGMMVGALLQIVGRNQMMAYLVMMAARQLAQDDRYQFQWWALSLVHARPEGGEAGSKKGKKGSDRGIDGVINFIDDNSGKPKRVLVQVKSGHVNSGLVRDLRGTVEREGAALGVFITLEASTKEMEREAVAAGFYHSPGWGRDYPRLQILTINDLLDGSEVQMPPAFGTFKAAQTITPDGPQQPGLF